MEPDKNKWIDEVISSASSTERAKPNPFLFEKILNRIREKDQVTVPLKYIWQGVAGFVLLICINFIGVTELQETDGQLNQTTAAASPEDEITQQIYEDYELVNSNVYFTYAENE